MWGRWPRLHRLGGPAARGGWWVETLTLLLEEPPATTSTSPVWAGGVSTVGLGTRQALVGPPEAGEDLVARSDGVFWASAALLIAVLGSDRCLAGVGQTQRLGAAVQAPGPLPQAVLFVSFKTKEVQKAMDEKRFEEAIQLRGR